eukprot:3997079-Pyramimonas_sp.AAC.1
MFNKCCAGVTRSVSPERSLGWRHAYRAPRHLSLDGNLSAALYAIRGFVAGCSFATTLIRVNSIS